MLIGMVCSLVFCSCLKDDETDDVTYSGKIKVSPLQIQIPKTNRAGVTVTLNSPGKWTSKCDEGVKCSPSSGNAGQTMVRINRTITTKKSALIFFECNDGGIASLRVELGS